MSQQRYQNHAKKKTGAKTPATETKINNTNNVKSFPLT